MKGVDMKTFRIIAIFSTLALGAALFTYAQGPTTGSSDTVAKKKKSADDTSAPAPDPDAAKIPSKYNKKDNLPQGVPVFTTDALTVSVDVAVLDNQTTSSPRFLRRPSGFSKTIRPSR